MHHTVRRSRALSVKKDTHIVKPHIEICRRQLTMTSRLLLASVAIGSASGLVLPAASMPRSGVSRVSMLSMNNDETRDSAPQQSFDNDMAGWKPPGGGGAAHTLGGEYTATDTPDFLPEEGSEAFRKASGVSFKDGMTGSRALSPCPQKRASSLGLHDPPTVLALLTVRWKCSRTACAEVDPNRKKSTGPELAGALDSDPDIYVPDVAEVNVDTSAFVLPEPSFKVSKMEVSDTDDEFEFTCSSTKVGEIVIDVKPVCMTFEDFYCGFTADSHPGFSVSPNKGAMERRNGPPTHLKVTW